MTKGILRSFVNIRNSIASHNFPGLRWVLERFNLVDKQRLKDVGPDRCAAEWIVKSGGKIMFDKIPDVFEDYNTLIRVTSELDPRNPNDDVKLIWIDATDTSITGYGCLHFNGLKNIKEVNLVRCKTFNDSGLEYIGMYTGNVLKRLQLAECPKITEYGLMHLDKFVALEELKLIRLKNVYKFDKVLGNLKELLPNCKIIT
uniref:ATP synthase subunit s, mitochondrial n=1 Tax=Strongyloides stercoralis TaxID=6248 RepID=A0A0K0ED72_STRER